jgi:septal ring factor EnvC (AmiA/AmiB activator)
MARTMLGSRSSGSRDSVDVNYRRKHMLIRNVGMLAVSTALLGAIGCDKPGAAEQQKENTAIQQNQQAQSTVAQQSAQAQAEMRDKISTAQAEFDKTRDEYSRDRETDLKEIDERISKLEERANASTAATRGRLEQDVANIRVQRSAFASDVHAIGAVGASDWDRFKSKVDDEYNALRDHLDKAP